MTEPLPGPAPEPAGPDESTWRAVLGAGSPREVLALLIEGDPLRLGERCQQRTRSQALLLDARRLYLRASAHVARRAREYQGSPSLDVWLAEHIRRSLKELVAEDQEALRVADVDPTTTDPLIHALADLLGVEPSLLLRGCAAFNQAPYNVRSAFFDILVDQMPIREWAARNGCDEARARASLKRALWLLGVHRDLDLDEFLGGRSDGS